MLSLHIHVSCISFDISHFISYFTNVKPVFTFHFFCSIYISKFHFICVSFHISHSYFIPYIAYGLHISYFIPYVFHILFLISVPPGSAVTRQCQKCNWLSTKYIDFRFPPKPYKVGSSRSVK